MNARRLAASALALLGLVVSSCGAAADARTELTVFAASSLTDAFTELAEAFETVNPGVQVNLNFAASSTLVAQVDDGAPADVLATADEASMARSSEAVATGTSVIFARNRLVLGVATGNPRDITGLEDLTRPGLLVGLCATEVPCGRAADSALRAAGVDVAPVTRAPNVRSLRASLELGELDAALIYRSDTIDADLDWIPLRDEIQPDLALPIAVVSDDQDRLATEFQAFVLTGDGQRTLREFGFESP